MADYKMGVVGDRRGDRAVENRPLLLGAVEGDKDLVITEILVLGHCLLLPLPLPSAPVYPAGLATVGVFPR